MKWHETTVQGHLKEIYLKGFVNKTKSKNAYVLSLKTLHDNDYSNC